MEPKLSGQKYEFINYLRVFAMVSVAWPHLVANMDPEWPVLHLVQWMINRPLHLIQNFGALGVSIFFVISGFLAAENLEQSGKFLKKKFIRIYIPVLSSMFAFYVFIKLFEFVGYTSYWSQFSNLEWLFSATLLNYLSGRTDAVNGVLWYLVPQFLFFIELTFWKIKENRGGINFAKVVLVFTVIIYIIARFIDIPQSLVVQFHYALIPLIGYIIRSSGQLTQKLKLLCVTYLEMVYGFWMYQRDLFETTSYPNSVITAVFIFLTAFFLENHFQNNRSIDKVAEVSYSFYLTHSLYGGFLISALLQLSFPWCIALLGGIVGALLFARMNYLCIEKPISKILGIK